MKKLLGSLALASMVLASSAAAEDKMMVGAGYTYDHIGAYGLGFGVHGFALDFAWQGDPVGVVTTYAYHTKKAVVDKVKGRISGHRFLVGPSYAFDDMLSSYAQLGFGSYNVYADTTDDTNKVTRESASGMSFNYAVGLMVNPMDSLSITVGYQGGLIKGGLKSNGVKVGAGFRF